MQSDAGVLHGHGAQRGTRTVTNRGEQHPVPGGVTDAVGQQLVVVGGPADTVVGELVLRIADEHDPPGRVGEQQAGDHVNLTVPVEVGALLSGDGEPAPKRRAQRVKHEPFEQRAHVQQERRGSGLPALVGELQAASQQAGQGQQRCVVAGQAGVHDPFGKVDGWRLITDLVEAVQGVLAQTPGRVRDARRAEQQSGGVLEPVGVDVGGVDGEPAADGDVPIGSTKLRGEVDAAADSDQRFMVLAVATQRTAAQGGGKRVAVEQRERGQRIPDGVVARALTGEPARRLPGRAEQVQHVADRHLGADANLDVADNDGLT